MSLLIDHLETNRTEIEIEQKPTELERLYFVDVAAAVRPPDTQVKHFGLLVQLSAIGTNHRIC